MCHQIHLERLSITPNQRACKRTVIPLTSPASSPTVTQAHTRTHTQAEILSAKFSFSFQSINTASPMTDDVELHDSVKSGTFTQKIRAEAIPRMIQVS